jgi:hypothetical protein
MGFDLLCQNSSEKCKDLHEESHRAITLKRQNVLMYGVVNIDGTSVLLQMCHQSMCEACHMLRNMVQAARGAHYFLI